MARRRRVVLVGVGALAALAIMAPVGLRVLPGGPEVSGVEDGAEVRGETLADLTVTGEGVEVLVDGKVVRTRREGGRLLLADSDLAEGQHTLTVRKPVALLPDREITRVFTVDDTPPRVDLDDTAVEDPRDKFTLSGRAHGATALTIDHQPVALDEHGRFALPLPVAPSSVHLVASDAAGNTAAQEYQVPVRHPRMRAVHMSALAWSSPALREPVLRMAREGRINTVQLDVKDENGEVGYRSEVPLARRIGAVRGHYDARKVLEQLHEEGIRVVARIVAFRDPILAEASWRTGKRDRVVQTKGGTPWSGSYGEYAFTNFANPEVVDYNLDLAKESAELGFDDILYDYVRRPEGPIEQMRLPGLRGTPGQAIAEFLGRSRDAVRPYGAFLGASVFGIAVVRATEVAQDIPAISRRVDYVSPMVYPSHWGPDEFEVDSPEDRPYDIVRRSLKAFADAARGSGAEIIPWLQAFSMRKAYGPAEVRAQIDAAAAAGAKSFLLWNAGCRYGHVGLRPVE